MTKTILKVPAEMHIRQRMRQEAAQLVDERKISPPVDFSVIEKLAGELVARAAVTVEYREFAMVLCGNEVWREIVAATPFNRRLLLLPQCLRNNRNCEATFDELGLLCAGCRHCLIDETVTVAENLGYATLVAEGTTVAIGLVEEGSVDAVIGVSCMSALEKSFVPVSRAAVPVIGIPLLYDGCENTEVDKQWLLEEIKAFGENRLLQPLSVSLLKNKVQSFFTEENLRKYFNGEANRTREIAISSMLQGGRRMRPVLAAMAYTAYAESYDNEILSTIALVIESFHKASLIHDDIEDGDDFRYEKETLHKTHGVPVALNTGDYLIGKGYELLAGLSVNLFVLQQAFRLVASAHVSLSAGQGDGLLNEKYQIVAGTGELLEIFRQKTGSAVKVAVLLGAVLGGADEREQEILSGFADLFGIAYQIHDDLNEYKNRDGNISVNNFPLMLSLLKEQIDQGRNDVLPEKLQDENYLLQLIAEKQTARQAEDLLDRYVQQVYRLLDRLENIRLRLALYGLTGKVFETEKKGR
ncbi:MAG: polyprenyl synthetase family protein [Prolixibacteraceae bacterium]|jgi:geranylgeranyl pyrophosphate synthase|nr:polyprenyl synthetase family protein [Prolixibacteraceae bacterium]